MIRIERIATDGLKLQFCYGLNAMRKMSGDCCYFHRTHESRAMEGTSG